MMASASTQNNRIQWTAQFLAAAELVRRGYTVCFTMGNHTPIADLMVGYQGSGGQFWVDVKGESSRRGWISREKLQNPRLYYVLVGVGKARSEDRFFVLSQPEMNEMIRRDRIAHPDRKGGWDGVNWPDALAFENGWDRLPR